METIATTVLRIALAADADAGLAVKGVDVYLCTEFPTVRGAAHE